jgi:putative tricarboxylic transport membrane protein
MSEGVSPSPGGARPGFSVNFHNLIGGLIIAALGLGFLGYAFYVPNAVIPRFLAGATLLTGVAVAAGLLPVRGPRDFYGGIALVLLSTLALTASAELPGQRGFAFGPGTAPRLFAGLLAFIGAAVAAIGLFVEGPSIEKYKIRGPLLVIISILLFAALIRPFGLIIATYLAFMVSILGSTEMRWLESLIAAAAMTALCWLLFVVLLNLPFQLWPQSNAPAILWNQFADIISSTVSMFQKAPARP